MLAATRHHSPQWCGIRTWQGQTQCQRHQWPKSTEAALPRHCQMWSCCKPPWKAAKLGKVRLTQVGNWDEFPMWKALRRGQCVRTCDLHAWGDEHSPDSCQRADTVCHIISTVHKGDGRRSDYLQVLEHVLQSVCWDVKSVMWAHCRTASSGNGCRKSAWTKKVFYLLIPEVSANCWPYWHYGAGNEWANKS